MQFAYDKVWRSIISISSSGFCSTTRALETNPRTICNRSTGIPGLIFKLWLTLSVAVRIFRAQGSLVSVVFVRRRSSYLMTHSALCVHLGCTNGAKCDGKVLPCFQICSGPVVDLGHPWKPGQSMVAPILNVFVNCYVPRDISIMFA